MKAFLCLAQEVPALADISSTSDALGIVSEELVLGPSGLTSTEQSTQIKQVSHTLPSKAIMKLAAASAVLSMITVSCSLSYTDVSGQRFLQEGTSGRQSFNWHRQWYVSPSACPHQAKSCSYAEPAWQVALSIVNGPVSKFSGDAGIRSNLSATLIQRQG